MCNLFDIVHVEVLCLDAAFIDFNFTEPRFVVKCLVALGPIHTRSNANSIKCSNILPQPAFRDHFSPRSVGTLFQPDSFHSETHSFK